MPKLNYTYDWLPEGRFSDDALSDEQAEGIQALARSKDPKKYDDLIVIGLTKGKRHGRFALEVVAKERDDQKLEHEKHRDAQLKSLQWIVIILALVLVVFASGALAGANRLVK